MSRTDDLGHEVVLPPAVRRVVSLVPSLTEAIAATAPGVLVAATDWCTYPPELAVPRVRGTKNPDWKAVVALAPDLVVANMEENREIDVRRMRDAGLAVWVTRIETVEQAFTSMSRLFTEGLGVGRPDWLTAAERAWSAPVVPLGLRVAVPVWRDPWFVVGSSTFAGDVLRRLGLVNVFGSSPERYPKVDVSRLTSSDVDLVLLPDEPYEFTPDDGPEAVSVRTALISGRALTWYGPSLVNARDELLRPILAAQEEQV
ncbi:MAG TPA: helical backbone metal receptor [Candidatus Angelobacter sp.]|nr:helical backbone metal receptor [Candidatus Angelobacter sp.]